MPIDFVVTWVDSSDPAWQASFEKYFTGEVTNRIRNRYRQADMLQYWFRAVEKFAPWVNHIYLVTSGQTPEALPSLERLPVWQKVTIVHHEDFMPHDILPTFSSIAIEMYLHRIPGLSEQFVYFNDDMFITNPVTPEYYFREGLPVVHNQEKPIPLPRLNEIIGYGASLREYCNVAVINKHFDRREVYRQSLELDGIDRWHGPHLFDEERRYYERMAECPRFGTFAEHHTGRRLLKSTYEEIWEKEPEQLRHASARFRQDMGNNIPLFSMWQIASNRFWPDTLGYDKIRIDVQPSEMGRVIMALRHPEVKSLCLNDCPSVSDDDYNEMMTVIREEMETMLSRTREREDVEC